MPPKAVLLCPFWVAQYVCTYCTSFIWKCTILEVLKFAPAGFFFFLCRGMKDLHPKCVQTIKQQNCSYSEWDQWVVISKLGVGSRSDPDQACRITFFFSFEWKELFVHHNHIPVFFVVSCSKKCLCYLIIDLLPLKQGLGFLFQASLLASLILRQHLFHDNDIRLMRMRIFFIDSFLSMRRNTHHQFVYCNHVFCLGVKSGQKCQGHLWPIFWPILFELSWANSSQLGVMAISIFETSKSHKIFSGGLEIEEHRELWDMFLFP